MVSGWYGQGQPGWFAQYWKHIIAPVLEAKTPYAIILGNHDDEADLSRRQILMLDKSMGGNLSFTQQGPLGVGGASNYYVNVFPSGNGSTLVPAARLWFFDSMDVGCAGFSGSWGCVTSTAVQWANDTLSKLLPVPSLAFVHIPLPETMAAWANDTRAVGYKGELSNCPLINTGLFNVLKSSGVGSVWSGHDHDNDYEASVESVSIGYGRKTGYGSYGILVHGARIIQLSQGSSTQNASTWITTESGARTFQQIYIRDYSQEQAACTSNGEGLNDKFGNLFSAFVSLFIIIVFNS